MFTVEKTLCVGSLALLLSGCGVFGGGTPEPVAPQIIREEVVIEAPVRTAPGVVEYVWEEPMVDVVEIPPGLDPDGVYYRPAHQSIVEIRQGRWKYYSPK
ncbi:hypothetical protein MRY87_10710 [bacterium]|nr:hypothetical protein [bacterium]